MTPPNKFSSENLVVQAREVPVIEDCDVCVIGGSCTGVFAAVRAAEMGAKVVVIDSHEAAAERRSESKKKRQNGNQ